MTRTWKNILSMSAVNAYLCSRNLKITPTELFNKSGPVTCSLFREKPLNSAAALKTTLTFPGLLTLVTAWWGRYHVFLGCMFASSSDSFLAYPFSI